MKVNYLLASVPAIVLLVACGDSAPETPTAVPAPSDAAQSINISGGQGSVDVTKVSSDVAPPPPAMSGMSAMAPTSDGLPTKDEDGKTLDTLAGLQRAVEFYNMTVAGVWAARDEEEEKRMGAASKVVPPLSDLKQLVEHRIIKALPQAPAGKKYTYDAAEKKVKLVNQ